MSLFLLYQSFQIIEKYILRDCFVLIHNPSLSFYKHIMKHFPSEFSLTVFYLKFKHGIFNKLYMWCVFWFWRSCPNLGTDWLCIFFISHHLSTIKEFITWHSEGCMVRVLGCQIELCAFLIKIQPEGALDATNLLSVIFILHKYTNKTFVW